MALLTYQSVNTNGGDSTTVVVTKPTGLSVGDLMLSQFTIGTLAVTQTPPSGFQELERATSGRTSIIYWKIADASDVAASDFTFQNGSTSTFLEASIIRISNPKASPIGVYSQGTASGSTVSIPTMTQSKKNSLLFFFTSISNGNYHASDYAIETNNPTWTEIYDYNASSTSGTITCAYARRLQDTATGTATALISDATTNVGQLVEILADPQVTTISETMTLTETISRKIKRSFSETMTLTETLTQKIGRLWTQITKPTNVWRNKSKN